MTFSLAIAWPYGVVTVDLRLPGAKVDGAVKAFANVTIPLGSDCGAITISGFSVIYRDGQGPRVAPPARKGSSRYFDIVALIGNVRRVVDTAILEEFAHQQASSNGHG